MIFISDVNVWKCVCMLAIWSGIKSVYGINYNVISNEIGYNEIGVPTSDKHYKPSREEIKYKKRRNKLINHWAVDVDGLEQPASEVTILPDNIWVQDRGCIPGFFEEYGYLRTIPMKHVNQTQVHSRYERKNAVKLFQEFFGIKATGKLNKKTVKVMKEKRCAWPDVRLDDPFSNLRNYHYYKYYPRWRRSILTWRASKYTKKISPLGLWKTLKKAFETWSAVSGLRFLYTRQNPDIQIDFEKGNHYDGKAISFDGKGRKAAHAFGPGTYTISGNIHLDDEEDWTQSVNPKDGINLLAVTIHEIGHSLGLQHSSNPRSVMYPAFVTTNLDLSIEDIENIQILYGPNPDSELMVRAEPTTSAPKICKISMDDIEQGPDGYTYIFRNSRLRQIDQRGKLVKTKNKVTIWDVYKNGPPRVDAVAYLTEKKKSYLFYNNTLWRYTNFDLDLGYPKVISGMPEKPRCAAFIRDQYGITRLLVFGAERFWEWSTGRNKVSKGYPLSTQQYFEGLPRSPIGALRWKDGYIYFLRKDKVYKVHPGSYNVLRGYPQPMPLPWMKDIC